MYKVVINRCYGGFSLSKEALWVLESEYGAGVVGEDEDGIYLLDSIERHDKRLVEVVETLGSESASGDCSRLSIEEIITPMYRIGEYDGYETLYQPEGFDWCDAGQEG